MKPTPLALIIGTVCHCAPLCAQELTAQPAFTPIAQSSPVPDDTTSIMFSFSDEPPAEREESLWHIAGRAAGDGIKTLGKLIARGDWSDDFNPATPRSPRLGLMADSKHHRFWYYRLQNRIISGQPSDADADFPELIPDDNPRDQPFPPPLPQPPRPQIPAYAALPAAFSGLEENLQTLFMRDAQLAGLDGRPDLFMAYYNGKDRQHAAVNAFDAESRYQGWLLGSRWALSEEDVRLGFSLALHKGQLTMVPQAQQGISSSDFTTQGLNALLSWQPSEGLQLALPLAVTQYRGDVSISGVEGKVARVRAQGGSIGLETGWRWQSGHHALTPVAGVRSQWLDINHFRDKDALQVSYQQQRELQLSGGLQYDYRPTDALRLGTEARYVQRSHHGRVAMSKEGDFSTGRGGHSLQFSGYAGLQLTDNVQLNLQMQTQQRLTREGVSDWNMQAGLRINF